MDLFDDYIHVLRVFLPRRQRDDITRELLEELRTQAADREAAFGRRLTLEEQAEVLAPYGHPMLTAARYRPQQSLIGPLVYPYYLLALKVVLGLVLAGHLVTLAVMTTQQLSSAQLGEWLAAMLQNVFAVVAWLTLVAAAGDRVLVRARLLERWNPTKLPTIRRTAARAVRPSARVPASMSSFVIALALSTWWLLALRYPYLMFGQGADDLAWGPAMDRLFPVLLTVQVLALIEHVSRLMRPFDRRVFGVTRVIWPAAGLMFIYVLATSDHQWVVWRDAADAATRSKVLFSLAGRAVGILDIADASFGIPFAIVAVGIAVSMLRSIVRRFGGSRPAAAAVAVLLALWAHDAQAQIPGDEAIRRILVDRVDVQKQSPGIVVGVVSPEGARVIAHGRFGAADARAVGGDTVFEIGSVTKVFTSLLLADMVRRGEVRIDDPIARYLPRSPSPAGNARPITLADLATHTSGLPFWPMNIPATADGSAAMAAVTVEQLFAFAAAFTPPPDVGTRWSYSNTDAGLLGALLARRAGSSYEALVADRITRPLGMPSTAVALSAGMASRLASGHDARLQPAARWDVPALPGAGSLHSSVNDLLRFLAAAGDGSSIVGAALPTMLATRRQAPGFQQAIGWMVLATAPGDEGLLLHDGSTRGFSSSMVYDPALRTGVVVLSNSVASVSDIARHLLRPALPLAKPAAPAPVKTEVPVDAKLFDLYAGTYAPGPGVTFTVTRDGDALMLQLPGLPAIRLRPESEREFFVAENTRVTVVFQVDAAGRVTGLLLRAPTGDVTAARASER